MQAVSSKQQEVEWENALNYFESLFHFRPSQIPLVVDKKKLKPWEAAATWIQEDGVYIQLKAAKAPWLYSLEEILSHELVHATRAHLEEPLFEEILAFSTSKSPIRKFFGPLFSTPKESLLFACALFCSWTGYTAGLFLESFVLRLFSWVLPALIFCYLLGRLFYYQRQFKRALTAAEHAHPGRGLSTLIHLKDEEILKLAASSSRRRGS